jgi:hypothetical protein
MRPVASAVPPGAAAVVASLGRETQAAHQRVVEAPGRIDVAHAQAQVVDEARRKRIGHVENVAPASTHPMSGAEEAPGTSKRR